MLNREQPIADGLDDAAAMLGDPGIDQFAVQHPQPFERTPLIGLHRHSVLLARAILYRGAPACTTAHARFPTDLPLLVRSSKVRSGGIFAHTLRRQPPAAECRFAAVHADRRNLGDFSHEADFRAR